MSSRTLNRKQFLVFTASAVGATVLAACGDDPAETGGTSGSGGTGGSGTAGSGTSGSSSGSTTGGSSAGSGTSGSSTGGSTAGSGGSTAGSGGSTAGSGGSTAGSGGASGGSGGAGGGGGSGGGGGGMCNADISVMSSGDHKHSLMVTAAQIAAGTDVTILSGGSNGDANGHKHQVKITAADFTALKAGMEVKKKSCAGGDHEYVLKCGAGASAPMAPTCTDDCGGDMAASACM